VAERRWAQAQAQAPSAGQEPEQALEPVLEPVLERALEPVQVLAWAASHRRSPQWHLPA
jgi:hypothetical protein